MVGNETWMFDMIRELGLYLAASPRSRYWQLQHLRDLDAERLADIGLTEAEAQLGRHRTAPLPVREGVVALGHAEAARVGAM